MGGGPEARVGLIVRTRDDGQVDAPDLTWRPLARADVVALADLRNLVEGADGTHQPIGAEQLADAFDQPRFDPARDTVSAWDGDLLVAAGVVGVRDDLVDGRALVGLDGVVHPDHRGRGTGAALLRAQERLGADLAARRFPGEPVRLRHSGGLEGSAAQRLLEQEGYGPDNRFVTMQVDLAGWEDPGQPSAAVAPDPDALVATRDAHNDAFRDHRNHSDIPADDWAHWTGSSASRQGQSAVVVEDGRVLSYALAGEFEPGVLHVTIVGTRREARGRGLGRQVLLRHLREARDAGYAVSELEVDDDSLTGANRLYEGVGYRAVRVISRYVKDVG
jgi:mycothiol synthase